MAERRVRDLMSTDVVVLEPDDSIHEAILLLAANGISGAPVTRDGEVIGVLSESDILVELGSGAPVSQRFSWLDAMSLIIAARYPHKVASRRVSDAMTAPPTTISPDAETWQAASVMHRARVKRLPVVNSDGKLEGILSRADLVQAMARDDAQIRTDVLAALEVLGDEVFEGLAVDVDEGFVTLTGRADRRSTRDIAVRIAARTPGVVQLRDRLEFDFDDTRVPVAVGGGRLDPRNNWNDAGEAGDPES